MPLEPEPLPDATSVLNRLRAALEAASREADLTIHLGDTGVGATGTPIADARGSILATVAGDGGSDRSTEASQLVGALVDSYGYVLEAEEAVAGLTRRVADLERVAHRDPLTGLLNRRAWEEAVRREEARCVRNPRPVAVVVIDLDRLKQVNDAHGHLAGDVMLRLAGGILREALRPSDVVARIGGDEFAALLVDVADHDPEASAERLERALAEEGVPASVGVAIDRRGDDLESAFQAADDAMYRRKAASRGEGSRRG